jgi:hypothetical protein
MKYDERHRRVRVLKLWICGHHRISAIKLQGVRLFPIGTVLDTMGTLTTILFPQGHSSEESDQILKILSHTLDFILGIRSNLFDIG